MKSFKSVWRSKYHKTFQKCDVPNMKCFRNVIFKIWNVSKSDIPNIMFQKCCLKHEMFQKRDVQNTKWFINVMFQKWNFSKNMTFQSWNVSETWHSKNEMIQKCEIPNMKCFRNVTFKVRNVSKMWYSKNVIFQKCDVPNMKSLRNVTFKAWKCSRNMTFKIWNDSEMWLQKYMFQKRDVFKKWNVPVFEHFTTFCCARLHLSTWNRCTSHPYTYD